MGRHTIIILALLIISSLGLAYAQTPAPGTTATGTAATGTPALGTAAPGMAGTATPGNATGVPGVTGATNATRANATANATRAAAAAPAAVTPSLVVNNQNLANNTITVATVASNGPGWVVIHNSINGVMGGIVGFAHVNSGTNRNVVVPIDPALATSNLFVELHRDAGRAGIFEFPSPDTPQMANGQPVTDSFVISAPGQTLLPGTTTTTAQPAAAAQPAATATTPVAQTAAVAQPLTTAQVAAAQATATGPCGPISYTLPVVRLGGLQGLNCPVACLGGCAGLATRPPAKLGSLTGLTGTPSRVGAATTVAGVTGTTGTIGTMGVSQPYVIGAVTPGNAAGAAAVVTPGSTTATPSGTTTTSGGY